MTDSVRSLVDCVERNRRGHLVVVTGAGISLASGIPTFRGSDPDAVWNRDVTELGTNRFFREDPVASWTWYSSRFDMVMDKHPNEAHRALVELENWQCIAGGRFTLITQNVDTLHEDAGSTALIKVHGSVDRVRCTQIGCEFGAPSGSINRADVDFVSFSRQPSLETLPKCPECGELLRQHVLWFDEYYDGHDDYRWPTVMRAAQTMDLVLFVGTSFAVGVTDLFLQAAVQRQLEAVAVDPGAREAPHPQVKLLREKSETLLPALCQKLGHPLL